MASIDKVETGWRLRWRTPEGASRSKTFSRKGEAERHRATVEGSKLIGEYIDPSAGRVTFADYATMWAATRVHRSSTAEHVESYMRVHVLPRLGQRPIGAIRHSEVQGFVKAIAEVLGPVTVENVFGTVSAVFRSAVRDRVVAVNPCEGVALPRRSRTEIMPPTVDQVRALLVAMPERYRVLGTLAAGAGLRQGEALGLTADRIDFLRRTLRVDRQLITPAKGEPRLAPPKSEASARTVPLADVVLTELAAHLKQFPPGSDGFLVTYIDCRPVKRNRFGAMWRQSVARAGLATAFRYHDLRHHFASALIAGGCSVKVVQKALGHASARETLDTYSHLWPDSDDLTRQAVDAALGAPVSPLCHPDAAVE